MLLTLLERRESCQEAEQWFVHATNDDLLGAIKVETDRRERPTATSSTHFSGKQCDRCRGTSQIIALVKSDVMELYVCAGRSLDVRRLGLKTQLLPSGDGSPAGARKPFSDHE